MTFKTRLGFWGSVALMVGACGRAEDPRACDNPSAGSAPMERCESGNEDEGQANLPPDRPCYGPCEDDSGSTRPLPLTRPICPEAPPSLGDACDVAIDLCTYGDSSSTTCRTFFTCADGEWRVPERFSGIVCQQPRDCPAEFPHGDACALESVNELAGCEYPGGYSCFCSRGSLQWGCWGPPIDTRCPERLPNIGEGCDVQALQCSYAPNGCNVLSTAGVLCFDGVWQESGLSCFG